MGAIPWLVEDLLTSQERLHNEVNYYLRFVYLYIAFRFCSCPQLLPSRLFSTAWSYGAWSKTLYLRGKLYVTATVFYTGKPRLGAADDVTWHKVAISDTYKGKYALQNNVCVFAPLSAFGPQT
jgi:hypothetical protein